MRKSKWYYRAAHEYDHCWRRMRHQLDRGPNKRPTHDFGGVAVSLLLLPRPHRIGRPVDGVRRRGEKWLMASTSVDTETDCDAHRARRGRRDHFRWLVIERACVTRRAPAEQVREGGVAGPARTASASTIPTTLIFATFEQNSRYTGSIHNISGPVTVLPLKPNARNARSARNERKAFA